MPLVFSISLTYHWFTMLRNFKDPVSNLYMCIFVTIPMTKTSSVHHKQAYPLSFHFSYTAFISVNHQNLY